MFVTCLLLCEVVVVILLIFTVSGMVRLRRFGSVVGVFMCFVGCSCVCY